MSLFRKTPLPEPSEPRRRFSQAASKEQRPQAFSYYAQRSDQAGRSRASDNGERQPLELQASGGPRAGLRATERVTVITAGIAVLIGLAVLTYLGPDPRIVPVTASGTAYFLQDISAYQETATNSLSTSIMNRNKLTVDTGKVTADLIKNYPELQSAAVVIPFLGQRPVIRIKPYPPAMILTTTQGGAYLIDTTGRALVSASQIDRSGDLEIPTVIDTGIDTVRPGNQTVPAPTIIFIQQIVAILRGAHIDVSKYLLPGGTQELDAYIAGQPYFVKFNLRDDARQQAGTFLAVKQRLEHDRTVPVEYIDVRLLGRAYYK